MEARCSDCAEDKYEKIIPNKDYTIVVPSYLVNAGDGYKVLKENHRKRVEGKLLDSFSHSLPFHDKGVEDTCQKINIIFIL